MANGGQKASWVHGGLVVFWIALWFVAGFMGWLKEVTFVSHLSMAALVLSSAGGWQAARAEKKSEDSDGTH